MKGVNVMEIGASTSNFYPEQPETALAQLLNAGFRTVEIFLNAPSELKPSFVDDLKRQCDDAGARVAAIHPFSSFLEPFFLFSPYQRRADDGLDMYKVFFETAARLEAPIMVLHGDKAAGHLNEEAYLERYERIYDAGASYGVTVAQENVVRFRSESLSVLESMRKALGDKAKFVCDFKQAGRCGLDPAEVIDVMGDAIVHVHISDRTDAADCLPPGTGTRDFKSLLQKLKTVGYDGVLMLELYRGNFADADDLCRAKEYLEEITCHL